MEDLILGSHVHFNKDTQIIGSIEETISYDANTFMFYTGAPQNTARMPLNENLIKQGIEMMKENNIDINNVIVHAPYIINLANSKNVDFNISFLKQEISRVEKLGITKLVLHPGSHVGEGIEAGIKNIIFCLNHAIDENTNCDICLETMAGKGSELGTNFEQLKQIIDGVKYNNKIKICLDTCHINDAGYDVANFDDILKEFDNIIGLEKLAVIHINDSKNEKGAHKDRHENFGLGTIGFDSLIKIIYHPLLKGIPKILETPYVEKIHAPYKQEIAMIKAKKNNPNLIQDIINNL